MTEHDILNAIRLKLSEREDILCSSPVHGGQPHNKLCIPFKNSLSEEQIDVFHIILDCVSDTSAAEMRAAYKVGFTLKCFLTVKLKSVIMIVNIFTVSSAIITLKS